MLEMQRSPVDPTATSSSGLTAPQENTAGAGTVAGPTQDMSGAIVPFKQEKKKKPNNGWTQSLETLVAEWADKASCYRWMHDKSAARYGSSNLWLTFPVILLSTITGTASFGINGLLPDNSSSAKYAGAAIGIVSLVTALIQTISNTLRYAQQSEGHRVAGIAWGKFQRFISIELSLHPDERMEAVNFLKMARIELDRLIEQSPAIPESVIRLFEVEHRKKTDIKRPEIAGGVEHTRIFTDKDSRLVKLAAEAALMISHKKRVMTDLVTADLDNRIIQKAREERAKMEEELKAELARVAREAAFAATIEANEKKNSVALTIDDGPMPASISLEVATAKPRSSFMKSQQQQPKLETLPLPLDGGTVGASEASEAHAEELKQEV
jgi:hypothetical protein